MSRMAFLGLCLLLAGLNGGCHKCSPCMDHYGDLIDDIGDHHPTLDCLYHPELDVSRIGQADWCSCPFNRWIGGCECAQWNFPGVAHGRCAACGQPCTNCPPGGCGLEYPHYVMPHRVAPRMAPQQQEMIDAEEVPPPALLPAPDAVQPPPQPHP